MGKPKKVVDVRVIRSADLATDHYVLVAKIRNLRQDETNKSLKQKTCREKYSTRIYKLGEEEIRRKYMEMVEEDIDKRDMELRTGNIKDKCKILKEILKRAPAETCGVTGTTISKILFTQHFNKFVRRVCRKTL